MKLPVDLDPFEYEPEERIKKRSVPSDIPCSKAIFTMVRNYVLSKNYDSHIVETIAYELEIIPAHVGHCMEALVKEGLVNAPQVVPTDDDTVKFGGIMLSFHDGQWGSFKDRPDKKTDPRYRWRLIGTERGHFRSRNFIPRRDRKLKAHQARVEKLRHFEPSKWDGKAYYVNYGDYFTKSSRAEGLWKEEEEEKRWTCAAVIHSAYPCGRENYSHSLKCSRCSNPRPPMPEAPSKTIPCKRCGQQIVRTHARQALPKSERHTPEACDHTVVNEVMDK